MSNIKKIITNNKMLIAVLISYLYLFISNTSMAMLAINNSLYYFKEMLIIMPVIMILTALIEAWVPKNSIEKQLGENSGIKGNIFAFLLGSFSAGPIYAAFPVCISLLKKGASISNIVILLSTWAVVKVPMLANEAKFLGLNFMIMRWVLTSVSIIIMGYIVAKYIKRDDVMKLHDSKEENTTLHIIEDYCIGCGLCAKLDKDVFEMSGNKAIVKDLSKISDKTALATEKCPAKAIIAPKN